jgi:histidine triad (HIT) family protein
MDCIFCKIASGQIPCKKVYENEDAIAFLDASPLSEGHTLIIPKRHFEKAHQMDRESAEAVGEAILEVSKKLVKKAGVLDYNVLQNNGKLAHQEVMHVHFHVIPKKGDKGLEFVWGAEKADNTRMAKLLTE